jgi:DNA-binding transcriptional ArsR family regulator
MGEKPARLVGYSAKAETFEELRVEEQATHQGAGAAVISAKLAKALANPMRARIMTELCVRPLSPSQFQATAGGNLGNISRYFRQLEEWGYIEVIEERRGGHRRGGIEHIYRRIQPILIETEEWAILPTFLREDVSANVLASYLARINEAIEAGTFDSETDRHLSWDKPTLDRQAFEELSARLDEVLNWLPELARESAERMNESGEEGIPTTVGFTAFRSPTGSELERARHDD